MAPMMRALTHAALALALLALTGCRDSPREVIEQASDAASRGDLVAMREAFSITTAQRLERAWQLSNTSESAGWEALAQKLQFDGKPLEITDETIHDAYARVDARAGVNARDYYLRKEDGRWRIELGAGMQFRKAEALAKSTDKSEGDESKDD